MYRAESPNVQRSAHVTRQSRLTNDRMSSSLISCVPYAAMPGRACPTRSNGKSHGVGRHISTALCRLHSTPSMGSAGCQLTARSDPPADISSRPCRVIIPAPTRLSHALSSAAVLWRPWQRYPLAPPPKPAAPPPPPPPLPPPPVARLWPACGPPVARLWHACDP